MENQAMNVVETVVEKSGAKVLTMNNAVKVLAVIGVVAVSFEVYKATRNVLARRKGTKKTALIEDGKTPAVEVELDQTAA